MVNFVEAQKPILHALVKLAGLRKLMVEVYPGTVMSFWVPKEKIPKKNTTKEIVPVGKSRDVKKEKEKSKGKKEKPAVMLVHGFAAEGIVTWQFQVGALTKLYSVYIPDLLFFGDSTTTSTERSPEFQAECLTEAMDQLGVSSCTVVGFSYGGMVACKMAETRPDLIKAMVVSGSVMAMTDSISEETMERLGFSSSKELLLPESVKGLKALLKIAAYKKLWFPEFLHRDYLKAMFSNRNERAALLEGLLRSNEDAHVPTLPQRILLLWGENDNIFNVELAKNMKDQLGDKATLQAIEKAGHLVHLERPCAYTRHLKNFLAFVNTQANQE